MPGSVLRLSFGMYLLPILFINYAVFLAAFLFKPCRKKKRAECDFCSDCMLKRSMISFQVSISVPVPCWFYNARFMVLLQVRECDFFFLCFVSMKWFHISRLFWWLMNMRTFISVCDIHCWHDSRDLMKLHASFVTMDIFPMLLFLKDCMDRISRTFWWLFTEKFVFTSTYTLFPLWGSSLRTSFTLDLIGKCVFPLNSLMLCSSLVYDNAN